MSLTGLQRNWNFLSWRIKNRRLLRALRNRPRFRRISPKWSHLKKSIQYLAPPWNEWPANRINTKLVFLLDSLPVSRRQWRISVFLNRLTYSLPMPGREWLMLKEPTVPEPEEHTSC